MSNDLVRHLQDASGKLLSAARGFSAEKEKVKSTKENEF